MQPPLPLVGEAIEQKGRRAGTWHTQPMASATAALGTSAPVLLGSYRLRQAERRRRLGLWPWGLPLPAVALVGMGHRKGPCTFCMLFVIYFESQSIDFEGLTPLANENLRALVR